MIDLIDYIDDFKMKTLKSFIKEHYEIEKLNYWDFINEDNYKYPDQEKFVTTLAKNIYFYFNKFKNKDKLQLDSNKIKNLNYKNIFFDNVEIEIINKKSIDGGYIAKKSNLTKENKFDLIFIRINKSLLNNLNLLCKVLMHEFIHARQHYSGIIRGKKSLEDLSGKNSSYAKTLVGTSDPEILCKQIINKLYKFEQSAYLSELHFEIDYKRCQDEDDLISKIKDSDLYKMFEEIYYSVQYIDNLSEENKEIFKTTYNEIKNTNLSLNKIKKNLSSKISNFLNKITNVAIEILHEYQDKSNDINENTIPQNNIFYLRYLNDSLMLKNDLDIKLYGF